MTSPLLKATGDWLHATPHVQSAVLFGSSATAASRDAWSDLDLHIVTSRPTDLEQVPWSRCLPDHAFCHQAVRPATGGVRKVTVIFRSGQLDLVVVPAAWMRATVVALHLGLHRRVPALATAMNEMATCLHSGYRFLKGQDRWGAHYARVARLPGVRLTDEQITRAADAFLCDLLWVLQKLDRGERVTAQHVLHTRLQDTNLRLWREMCRRQQRELPSFGLGRRIEMLATANERALLTLAAPDTPQCLRALAWQSLAALEFLAGELVPAWRVPPDFRILLDTHRAPLTPGR